MKYLKDIQQLLEAYPHVEVTAQEGLDFELDRPTITYYVNVGGVELQFLTYSDEDFNDGQYEDFLQTIEAMVNSVA